MVNRGIQMFRPGGLNFLNEEAYNEIFSFDWSYDSFNIELYCAYFFKNSSLPIKMLVKEYKVQDV